MLEAKKVALVDQLLSLHASHAGAESAVLAGPDVGQLRQQIEQALAAALTNTQEVDSRRVTILLSDLRGFTSASEQHSALVIVQALNRYFARMSEIIIRHNGTIDKFMGDAIMVLFGAPQQRDDDIQAAMACAIEMQIAMADINAVNLGHGLDPFYMGIGINTGQVVAGHLGSALYSEYTVIGDQVNLASRVEAHSLRGQILLSENTYQLAKDDIDIGAINEVSVKGKKGMVRMYELLGTERPRVLKAPQREIRNSPRVQVDMPVAFQILEGKSVLPQHLRGNIIDISYGGMYIASPVRVEPFTDIKITLSTAIMVADLTDIYAKVLRTSLCDAAYVCCVEFTSMNASAQRLIKELVDGIVELNQRSF